jgi:hypothetical protein
MNRAEQAERKAQRRIARWQQVHGNKMMTERKDEDTFSENMSPVIDDKTGKLKPHYKSSRAKCKVAQFEDANGLHKRYNPPGVEVDMRYDERGRQVTEYTTFWVQDYTGWTVVKDDRNGDKVSLRPDFDRFQALIRDPEAGIFAAEMRTSVYYDGELRNQLHETFGVRGAA